MRRIPTTHDASSGIRICYYGVAGWCVRTSREGGDDAVEAKEQEVVEVEVDDEGGQDGDVEAEVVLPHHVARARRRSGLRGRAGRVEHAAGGGR